MYTSVVLRSFIGILLLVSLVVVALWLLVADEWVSTAEALPATQDELITEEYALATLPQFPKDDNSPPLRAERPPHISSTASPRTPAAVFPNGNRHHVRPLPVKAHSPHTDRPPHENIVMHVGAVHVTADFLQQLPEVRMVVDYLRGRLFDRAEDTIIRLIRETTEPHWKNRLEVYRAFVLMEKGVSQNRTDDIITGQAIAEGKMPTHMVHARWHPLASIELLLTLGYAHRVLRTYDLGLIRAMENAWMRAPGVSRTMMHTELGFQYLHSCQLDRAYRHFQRVPTSLGKYGMIQYHIQRGEYPKAATHCETILRYRPSEVAVHQDAWCLCACHMPPEWGVKGFLCDDLEPHARSCDTHLKRCSTTGSSPMDTPAPKRERREAQPDPLPPFESKVDQASPIAPPFDEDAAKIHPLEGVHGAEEADAPYNIFFDRTVSEIDMVPIIPVIEQELPYDEDQEYVPFSDEPLTEPDNLLPIIQKTRRGAWRESEDGTGIKTTEPGVADKAVTAIP